MMIYAGRGSQKNWLAYGLDDNLDKWSKPEVVPNMRRGDPDCWPNGDTYYAASGGRNLGLMKSSDLKNWQDLGDLLHADYPADLGVGRGTVINSSAAGLAERESTVTFAEFTFPDDTPISTEFSSLGVTFSPSLYYRIESSWEAQGINRVNLRSGNLAGDPPITADFCTGCMAPKHADNELFQPIWSARTCPRFPSGD
ncbi:MAG: hypothetical protein ACKV19_21330, partial [Verrucomicrobiales bacterium]